MFERNISENEVLSVINKGKTIQDYPDDKPYPSKLVLIKDQFTLYMQKINRQMKEL
jgi:hypothetical protein